MAEKNRGMGPRPRRDPVRVRTSGRSGGRAAPAAGGDDLAEPEPAAPQLRRGVAAGAGRVAAGAGSAPAGPGAPARGRHLRADRGRAPLARGPARRPRRDPGDRARARRRRVARARADREHGARGPQPGRAGARLRGAGGGARAHARGGRPPRRPQPGRRVQPAAAARPARRGARHARPRRSHRGPRPRDPARRRSRRPPAFPVRAAIEGGWSVCETESARAAAGRRSHGPARLGHDAPRPGRRAGIAFSERRSPRHSGLRSGHVLPAPAAMSS